MQFKDLVLAPSCPCRSATLTRPAILGGGRNRSIGQTRGRDTASVLVRESKRPLTNGAPQVLGTFSQTEDTSGHPAACLPARPKRATHARTLPLTLRPPSRPLLELSSPSFPPSWTADHCERWQHYVGAVSGQRPLGCPASLPDSHVDMMPPSADLRSPRALVEGLGAAAGQPFSKHHATKRS